MKTQQTEEQLKEKESLLEVVLFDSTRKAWDALDALGLEGVEKLKKTALTDESPTQRINAVCRLYQLKLKKEEKENE